MTTTIAPKSTVYYLSVPFASVAWLSIELPEGLSDAEVLERISFQDTHGLAIDDKAIRCTVADSITERNAGIVIEAD